jgi:hypothetical protein
MTVFVAIAAGRALKWDTARFRASSSPLKKELLESAG